MVGSRSVSPTAHPSDVEAAILTTDSEAETRVCVFSTRNLYNNVSRTADYRFEDIICEVDHADLVAPRPGPSWPVRQRVANRLAERLERTIDPGLERVKLDHHYDLFFAKCLFASDLLALNAVPDWRDRCDVAVCWLAEVFVNQLDKLKGHLHILQQFDYVLLNMSASAGPIQDAIGVPCTYTIPGIDALMFSPYPNPPTRSIDVYSLGRRSAVTHASLMRAADAGDLFYVYDTLNPMNTSNPTEHRKLTANLAKRSRYFVANPAKVNVPGDTEGQIEIGYRFLEGAAAGTIMIGETPNTKTFARHFDWPDAHIDVPYDTEDLMDILNDLDSQPERLEKARRLNVANSLRRYDWAHSWRTILEIAGLDPTDGLTQRAERLEKVATMAECP